jgi:ribose transport system ATP-binding protein
MKKLRSRSNRRKATSGAQEQAGSDATRPLEAQVNTPDDVLLSVTGLSKTFGGTRALKDVSLELRVGEVLALVGHNGSGKSTLIKILAGIHIADPGATAELDGEAIDLDHIASVGHGRLRFVHQDLGLVLELSAMENLALRTGFARTAVGRIRWEEQRRLTRETLKSFDIDLDVDRPLAEATPVQRTVVAICSALHGWAGGRGVLVLDEPTAVLPPGEVAKLFAIVAELQRRGTSVLYVSHRLEEIFAVAQRVIVLRGGRVVGERPVDGLTKGDLVTLMVGEAVDPNSRYESQSDGRQVVLEAEGLTGRYLRNVAFQLFEGEILGFVGRPGSGRDELPMVIAGHSEFPVKGRLRSPTIDPNWSDIEDGSRSGISIVPADRATEGLVAEFSLLENLTLSALDRLGSKGRLSRKREELFASEWIKNLGILGPGAETPITTLSGGNQQKVLLGRALATDPKVLILCEPTAGVDISTRRSLYAMVAERARDGVAVIVASSDIEDVTSVCSRVLVFDHGSPIRELVGDDINERAIVDAMEGHEVRA